MLIAGLDLDPTQLERVEAYRILRATFWLLMVLPSNPGHNLNPEGSAALQAAHVLDLLDQAAT